MFSVFSVCHSVCLSTVGCTFISMKKWPVDLRLKRLLVVIFGHVPVSLLMVSLWFLCRFIHSQYYNYAKSHPAFFLKYRAILCNISLSQGHFQIRLRGQGRTCYCASCLRCNGGNRISEDRYIMWMSPIKPSPDFTETSYWRQLQFCAACYIMYKPIQEASEWTLLSYCNFFCFCTKIWSVHGANWSVIFGPISSNNHCWFSYFGYRPK